MMAQLRAAVASLLLLTLVTGLAYPLLITGVAQVAFPHQANGSLLERDGARIGSELIGQAFTAPKYFWGRPSATSPAYNGAASSGSNLGPTNPTLAEQVNQRIASLRAVDAAAGGSDNRPVPVDLVTASASGLDPHISPRAAEYQVQRVAQARGLSLERVREAVRRHTHGRTLAIFGAARVAVLPLNLELDTMASK